MSITKEDFGVSKRGEKASLYTITNASGAYIKVTDYGVTIVEVVVPDRSGTLTDVVLGYDSLDGYMNNDGYFGATIGRNGNRVANAAFSLNGKEYKMQANEGNNNLHSGPDGFDQFVWPVKEISEETNSITFSRISPDGEQGFPGNLNVSVRVEFSDDNELILDYSGACDADTVTNLTNHSYFNLAGHDSGSNSEIMLQIFGSAFTPVGDSTSIPTGEIRPVEGTPMDFREPKPIGKDIDADYEQLNLTGGYDHNYVLDDYEKGVGRLAVKAWSEKTGIAMDMITDTPGVQLYAGNFITDRAGRNGATYHKRSAFCLETQYYPDAVNQPEFPSPVTKAGELYESATIYRFYVR